MGGPERPPASPAGPPRDGTPAEARSEVPRPRYGRYAGLLAILILVLITINTIVTKPNGATGIEPGRPLAPFAVPLALGGLHGDADVATRAREGTAGRVPACSLRGPGILNICQLYERGPVVLALFVNAGSCPAILSDLQSLQRSFPGVQFAGVAIRGSRGPLRKLIRSRGLSLPLGIDADGVLVALYKVASCPQVTLAYPGGVVQSKAILTRPSYATLRARVAELVAASKARGWRPPAG
jgi:hypothetical protein